MSKSSEEGAAGSTSPQDGGTGNGGQKDANGNIYEDRGRTKKIIRVVTVMAYVFSVSFVAILLSAYYVFLWEPPNPRLQRHPLTGDPQAEFLIDDLSLNPNRMNRSEDRTADFVEDPNARINIFRKIMTSDKDFSLKLATLPQKLFTYEDLLELNRQAEKKPEDPTAPRSTVTKTPAVTSGGVLTTLPIFFKTYSTMATPSSLGEMPKKRTLGSTWSLVDKRKNIEKSDSSSISGEVTERVENYENYESIDNSSTPGEILDYESNTSDVTSTVDPGATVYPRIGNYSYREAIGRTVKNNQVTIGAEPATMSETSTPQTTSELPNDPDDDTFDMGINEDWTTTKHSEVQIYPEEILRDIIDSEK